MNIFVGNPLKFNVNKLGGPRIEMKTGRKDSRESYAAVVEDFLPNHNDTISLVLSRFQAIGVDQEGTVALLGNSHHLNNLYRKNCLFELVLSSS